MAALEEEDADRAAVTRQVKINCQAYNIFLPYYFAKPHGCIASEFHLYVKDGMSQIFISY